MDRIKNIEEAIVGGGEVLLKMVETKKTKSGIILPDDKQNLASDLDTTAYGIVAAVGADIKDLEIGDIVLKTRNDKAPGYSYKNEEYIMVSRYNIAVAVKPVNFDNSEELSA